MALHALLVLLFAVALLGLGRGEDEPEARLLLHKVGPLPAVFPRPRC